ncbi:MULTISPECIES: GMC family oxidoreductase [Pseudomonas]|jgi:choline dehydrogenase|uniref:GMC family oxidoreductase n=1 Tax=Pseudomonas TaxID=286 RepID=UPI0002A3F4C3|nr:MULTISPECIES: GMC family oxidoreductase N-terminal domain-containing protein [Pseudomonas]KES21108.1 hypothetical protein FG99_27080 [Pseudomonas sp. AAC]MBB1606987.1 hypothetical protein [Pseudomonas sp. UMC76]MBB1637881.1 hypothetical protein [Pseudomonas sp. UME83]MBH3435624.1 GMC family oxidoreductase N-terminal domain-containing protein [Pseudomonas citronellolis]NTX88615.1 hypothetical protein [Pseudomonas sp. UMA643]
MSGSKQYDYIIVGAGSAGCALAGRLSEDPAVSVLLLEAGPKDWDPRFSFPLGEAVTVGTRYDWSFKSEPEPELQGQRFDLPRGRVLGGSSSINGKLYVRGNALDYDEWEALGNPGWGFDSVLPCFMRSERWEAGPSPLRGDSGPLETSFGHYQHSVYQAFIDAGTRMGFAANPDYNGPSQEGFAWSQYTHTHESVARCSSARAYLRPAKDRGNLTILTGAVACRLLLDGDVCEGVVVRHKGREATFRARMDTVLSAGAYQSPQLLMLSGVGDPELLAEHGIATRHVLPGVGRNLQDHFGSTIQYESRTSDTYYRLMNPVNAVSALLQYVVRREGPFSVFPMNALAFVKTLPELARPDVQFLMFPSAVNPNSANDPWPRRHALAIQWAVCRPRSRGEVTLNSADPLDPPRISHRFLSDEADKATNRRAFRLARELFRQEPLRALVGEEFAQSRNCTTDAQIDQYMSYLSGSHYHPVGTCKMGSDDMAVVDARLRVHGIRGLRVVDASIMPTIVGGNTNAPSIMIGERAAELIVEERRNGLKIPA